MNYTFDSDRIIILSCPPLPSLTLSYTHVPSLLVGVGPASVMVGNLVAGKRIAQAAGRDLGMIDDQDLVRKVSVTMSVLAIFNQSLTMNLITC